MTDFVIVVHGGAGRAGPPERDEARRRALAEAAQAGWRVLDEGGSALAAVAAAVVVLEDAPDFNAGRGSVLTRAGHVETDAAVMDGASGRVGAVTGLRQIRNPVMAARAVLADGRHVLIAGPAAEAFARTAGIPREAPEWFVTDRRRLELAEARDSGLTLGGGTVGAVALDRAGHVAAATSTGGRSGQLPGRVGDSPIPGAGTWADDATVAISGTGDGEAFLRVAFAHEVDARMRLARCSLESACEGALELVTAAGGAGGCIAVDATGRVAMPFTTEVMYRASAGTSGEVLVGLLPGRTAPWPPPR